MTRYSQPEIDESPTPGPWHIGNAHNAAEGHAVCADHQVLARVVPIFGDRVNGNERTGYYASKGNARLIAAAPELLAALVNAERDIRQCLIQAGWTAEQIDADARIQGYRAAIAKATGGAP